MIESLSNNQLDTLHRRIARKWRFAHGEYSDRLYALMWFCSAEWRRRQH